MAVLIQHAHESHLAGLGIGEIELVAHERDVGTPHAVVELQGLAVFGVARVLGQRQLGRIVRGQRVQVLINESFQTRPVGGIGGPRRTQRNRHAAQN
jgi:hypothetical protein